MLQIPDNSAMDASGMVYPATFEDRGLDVTGNAWVSVITVGKTVIESAFPYRTAQRTERLALSDARAAFDMESLARAGIAIIKIREMTLRTRIYDQWNAT